MPVSFYKLFCHRQEFDPELRTRLLTFVDDPHISLFIRMNIVTGQFIHVGIGQPRKTAKYEYVPDNGCFVIRNLYIHYST